jgi:hypothetical protein
MFRFLPGTAQTRKSRPATDDTLAHLAYRRFILCKVCFGIRAVCIRLK